MDDNKTQTITPPPHMKGILVQMVFAKSLSVAAEKGIADILAEGAKTAQELSEITGLNAGALHRLVRLLTAHGIFKIDENGAISNSPVSEYLRSDIQGSQRNFARMMGSKWMWQVFNELESSLETGEGAFGNVFPNMDNLFQYFKEENPQAGKIFSQSMSSMSYAFDETIAASYDFSDVKTVLDIGGAEGNLLKNIKSKNPHIQAALFELPHVIEQLQTGENAAGLSFVKGNFFEEVNALADCITIKYVLHNWTDEKCVQILKNCRKAITNDGKLLIVEMLLNENEKQVFEKSMDIVMLLLLGAAERTKDEFEKLLSLSGFALSRIISTASPLYIIEAIPV